ncbi:FkbM family methyltransferase [Parerythrobacter aestuarii]|uniref:FkbM family methyltransferase n=1 Tax=Parerythrobacter aestuarii TaxID=3020909 RepID=UPI0024DED4C3|nr:FkbM family methyltransferase [Parerythrobacter aestuarii]
MRISRMIRNLAGSQGLVIRREPDGAALRAVLAGLRPVETGHELVRLGAAHDGGYLVPDDLDGIAAVFSPGVDTTAEFERDCIARGIRSFQADGSIERSPLDDAANDFEPKYIGIDSHGDTITLDDWVAAKAPGSEDLMLQMDIEGHEWLALAQASDALLGRFRVIVLELHHLDALATDFGRLVMAPVITRLSRHFDVVHMHANNHAEPLATRDGELLELVEVTLLRKDRSQKREPVSQLPHPLDADNVPDRPPIQLPPTLSGMT